MLTWLIIGGLAAAALISACGLNKSYHHLAAWYNSALGPSTNVALNGVADGVLTQTTTTTFVAPSEAQLMWTYGGAATAQRMRLNTPTMRLVSLPSLIPIDTSLTVPSPPNICDLSKAPIRIPKVDLVSLEASDGTGTTEPFVALGSFMFDFKAPPQFQLENGRQVPARRYWIRATGSITAVTGSWVSGGLTLDQALQNGQYVITGLDVVGANLVGARLIFAGSGYRPGVLCRNAVGSAKHRFFETDAMGCYGTFENINTPQLEILAIGANTVQEVFMEVVRVGEPGESPGL